MTKQLILGIDPGFSGALGLLQTDLVTKKFIVSVMDMPVLTSPKGKTEIDYTTLFEVLRSPSSDFHVTAILERVASRPNQSAPATFRFGQGYGAIEMALCAHKIPVQYVTPAVWKKHFNLSKDKGASRSLAKQRFPDLADQLARVKDDGRAEAILIALFGHEKLL